MQYSHQGRDIENLKTLPKPPLMNHPQLNSHHLQKFDPGVRFYSLLALFFGAAFTLKIPMVRTLRGKAAMKSASAVEHSVLLTLRPRSGFG